MSYCEYYKCTNVNVCKYSQEEQSSNLCIAHCKTQNHNHCTTNLCEEINDICIHSKCEHHCKKLKL